MDNLKKIAEGKTGEIPTEDLAFLLLNALSPFYYAGVDENLPFGTTEEQILSALEELKERKDCEDKEAAELALSFLRERKPGTEHTFWSPDLQMLSHSTHGVYFGVAVEDGEMKLSFRADGSEQDGFGRFALPECRAGNVVREGKPSVGTGAGKPVFDQKGKYAVLSLWLDRDGISGRETVFCYEGGICVLGCDFWDEKEDSVLLANVNHCFADEEKMKIHEHSVTQGAFIYRSLFDDVPFRKHIRVQNEKRPGAAPEAPEKRNVFTIYQTIPNEFPCFAYEVTNIGMAHSVEVLSDNDLCQAIMLDGGVILSFDPQNGKLKVC